MTAPGSTILVIGPSWVGDMVMAQSLFKLLKRRHPAPRIHVLAPGLTRPLLARMPEIEQSIDLPLGHGRLGLGERRRLALALRNAGYQQAIVLPNSWKSALIPHWANIPLRTGWRGEWRYGLLNDIRRLDRRALPMTVQRFMALGQAPGDPLGKIPTPRLAIRSDRVQTALQQLGLSRSPQRPLLALCPGAEYGPAKQWPAAYYGQLARRHHADGWDLWLFGSAKDRRVCAEVNAAAGGLCRDLSGRTDLGQAVDLLSLANQVVSNDSGLMHVAAALGHPLVALFGSSDPTHTPPLGDRTRVLSLNLPCSPCFKRTCPLGHTDCLQHLPPERVISALDTLPVRCAS